MSEAKLRSYEAVKHALRREVNWGCPVADCGIPYLTYHHFDPPYHKMAPGSSPRLEGMIALCAEHHALADGGVFSQDQLRRMKREPFLSRDDEVRGHLDWMRRKAVVACGGVLAVNTPVVLEVAGKPIIWIRRSRSGYMLLNVSIRDEAGHSIFAMEDNDWTVVSSIEDLEVAPQGRSLRFKSGTVQVTLSFTDLNPSTLETLGSQFPPVDYRSGFRALLSNEDSLLVRVIGDVHFRGWHRLTENAHYMPNGSVLMGNLVVGGGIALSIS